MLIVLLAGCDEVFLDARPDALVDAPSDAPPPTIEPFGDPVKLAPFDTTFEDDDPSMTADGLELYLLRSVAGVGGEIYRSVRTSTNDPWPDPTAVTQVNSTDSELRPAVSADGLTLYFGRGPVNDRDIYVATRASRTATWSTPVLAMLDRNVPGTEELPGWTSADGLTLMFESNAGNERDLYLATRTSPDAAFTSVPFAALNQAGFDDGAPWATPDGTRVVFQSNRSGTAAFWEAVERDGTWYLHRHVNLDTQAPEGTPWLSPDGSTIVFSRTTDGNDDLWIATRPPIAAN